MDRGDTRLFRSLYPHAVSSRLGLYLHIPFCRVKCPYCSFVVFVRRDHLRDDYVRALASEVVLADRDLDPDAVGVPRRPDGRFPVDTVYLGGGTPSLLSTAQLASLLDAIRGTFDVSSDAEITVETEPGTTDATSFSDLAALGVNRVTLGVQSFHPHHLHALGRAHSAEDARAAVHAARAAGIASLDLDLIFGLPNQTAAEWDADLAAATALGPDHLSLYGLTIEPGTPFGQLHKRGALPLPEEDAAADMMRAAMGAAQRAGLEHYEISNFARPGHASRHNRSYWEGSAYLGLGVGAHGFLPHGGAHARGERSWNLRSPEQHIAAVRAGTLPVEGRESLDEDAQVLEGLYLGLRQRRGLDRASFRRRHGFDPVVSTNPTVRQLLKQRWIRWDANFLSLTEEGVIIADYVIGELGASLDTLRGSDTVGS